jgi:chaperone modulatory protein CbpM
MSPQDKDVVIIADYTEQTSLTLDELCDICRLTGSELQVFIEYDIVQPNGQKPEEWLFDLMQLQRIQTAMRLQRDLELNLAGVVVVLDLLQQMEQLQSRLLLLERHYF